MNVELLLFGFGSGVVGIVIGLVVANVFKADNGSLKKIEAELAEAQEKLKRQAEHFAESENMLHKLGTDLRDLYQHMSSNEISTLKEKFKGLVIEADTHLDELAHKEEAVAEQAEAITAEKTSEEAVDEVIEELAEPVELTEQDTPVEASEEVAVETESEDAPAEDVEVAINEEDVENNIKDKINETIDELAQKNKQD